MKKIMIASLGLSLLSGTAVFAQNTSTGSMSGTDTSSTKTMKKMKKGHKKGTDTMSSTTSTSTSK